MTIWLASGNSHKAQELAAILPGLTVKLPADGGIKNFDPRETGSNFVENALIKAETLYRLLAAETAGGGRFVAGPVLADDSGLCVDALEGRPGIYSARYQGMSATGVEQKLDAAERNALLLEEVNAVLSLPVSPAVSRDSHKARSARFVCAMVLYWGPDRFYAVQETLEGEIVSALTESRGSGGFGYDPIMYLPELGRTVAELSEDEKNALSHRGKAARAIAKLLG
jgi:XTP/dITP diphosphohydrolase